MPLRLVTNSCGVLLSHYVVLYALSWLKRNKYCFSEKRILPRAPKGALLFDGSQLERLSSLDLLVGYHNACKIRRLIHDRFVNNLGI
ncbi:hypothetical protein VAE055_350017 [Vibrio aestuarianus]|nr:hypothetical protein VAE055_350017 [Vibrio aestuarianus]CAH8189083.1 hypothetical protein VAE128_440489 [Vibrio aestuarianus]